MDLVVATVFFSTLLVAFTTGFEGLTSSSGQLIRAYVLMNSSKDKVGEYTQVSTEPEVHYNGASDLEVVPPHDPESYSYSRPQLDEKIPYAQNKAPDQRRVFGVTPLIFWILIFTIVILLAAGRGAGLGAGLSTKSTNKAAEK